MFAQNNSSSSSSSMTTNTDQVQNTAIKDKRHSKSGREEKYMILNTFERTLCGISDQSKIIQKERKSAQIRPFINIHPKMVRHAEYQNSGTYARRFVKPDDKLAKTLKSRVAAQMNRDKKSAYIKSIEKVNTQLLQKVKELEAQIKLLQQCNTNLWRNLFISSEKIKFMRRSEINTHSECGFHFNAESLSPEVGGFFPDYDDIHYRNV